ncbi:MAG: hypothetical protein J2P50_10920 [Hyphomicrobiaceae bacterium]|nr:hypothetical protein [Hyphomicrobiaceae bacterium]
MRRAHLVGVGWRVGAVAARLACWLPCLLLSAPLWAGQVRVEEGKGPEQVVVDTSDAGVDEVLAALAGHFGFAVERRAAPAPTVRYSGRLQGSLDAILDRVLRHEGHIIVHSREAQAGIERVVVLDAKGGPPAAAPAASAANPIAAIKAKLREREKAGR